MFLEEVPELNGAVVIKEGFLEEVAAKVWGGMAHAKAGGVPWECCALGCCTQAGHTFSSFRAFALLCHPPRMPFPF